jgi:hypothetical protein
MATPRERFAAVHGEKAADTVQRKMLEGITRSMGEIVRGVLCEEGVADMIGFTLVMFEYGDKGSMAYASTAEREDFLRLLDELRGKLAAEVPGAPRGD